MPLTYALGLGLPYQRPRTSDGGAPRSAGISKRLATTRGAARRGLRGGSADDGIPLPDRGGQGRSQRCDPGIFSARPRPRRTMTDAADAGQGLDCGRSGDLLRAAVRKRGAATAAAVARGPRARRAVPLLFCVWPLCSARSARLEFTRWRAADPADGPPTEMAPILGLHPPAYDASMVCARLSAEVTMTGLAVRGWPSGGSTDGPLTWARKTGLTSTSPMCSTAFARSAAGRISVWPHAS